MGRSRLNVGVSLRLNGAHCYQKQRQHDPPADMGMASCATYGTHQENDYVAEFARPSDFMGEVEIVSFYVLSDVVSAIVL